MGATLFKVLLWIWGTLIVGIGVNWVSNVIEWKSLLEHPVLASVGFLLLAGSTGWTFRAYRFAEAAKHFDLFKEAKDLLPEDLDFQKQKPGTKPNPDYRPYNETYIPRKAEASNVKPDTASVYGKLALVRKTRGSISGVRARAGTTAKFCSCMALGSSLNRSTGGFRESRESAAGGAEA